ncbi:hypothetical protein ColTof4_02284 [Colletotrichum tofieldiae]|uniref:Uncharacterized protein n=1 Tax=Colletotrichum liriopes TaxID=708192 RepID=A0AA37LMM0_9PEZI|nr:hypothetical protein ColLi_00789 [Colletotrichum liriopes]GKT62089.1 hypothetical protein ColTof3_09428 [Colletotrichum tofieldiae]GKT69861.1 hypothetical protein ColTof4_02284 [Colletotrichum tofieldiae]GKT92879.1 hypothetical protein Ct61P_10729 [Colletotrichum tofieldiae]
MPSSDIQKGQLQSVLESKGIRFHVKTGGAKYECHLQDRSSYERVKATRTNSSDSQTSSSSASTVSSTH